MNVNGQKKMTMTKELIRKQRKKIQKWKEMVS